MFKRSISALAVSFVIGVTSTLPVMADGGAGAYLAARTASVDYDFKSAAQYYIHALMRDPGNPGLMENAILAMIGAGDFERSIPVARQLQEVLPAGQIANMVMLADAIKTEDYSSALESLEAGEVVGPLVDSLVLAWAQVGQGDMSQAISSFDEIAAQSGLQTFGLYHKALALALVGDLEGAEGIFSGASGAALPPTRRGIIARLEVLSQLERNDDAIDLIDAVFGDDLDPNLTQIRANLEAGETLPLKAVTSARDGVAEVFFSVASVLAGEATDSYTLLYTRTAEYLRPDHVESILQTANLLEQLGRYELATEAYDRIPRDNPAFHAAELGRADTLFQAGKTDAAIEVLQQLSKNLTEQANVHIALGDLLRQLERYEEATQAYDRAVALYDAPEPIQWIVYFSRGITYERTDKWPLAEADFRKALELQPGQPQVLNYLGYSFVEMQSNMDEALDMIERAVAARPDDGYITDSLGWVLYRLGRYEESVGFMERAAALEPVDPIVNDHLGDVFWAVGRKREAEFQWYRALSFEPEDTEANRIRRKLDVGLDAVLKEEGSDPIKVSNDG